MKVSNIPYPLLAAAAMFAWAGTSHAACTGSSPTWTASADQASVSSCISSASSGDTIKVSSGSATWNGITLPSTKDLTITGAGKTSTIITCSSGICLTVPPSRTYVVSGFEFRGNGGLLLHRLDAAVPGKSHRIHHNRLTHTGGGYGSIDIVGEPAVSCNETNPVVPTVLYDNNEVTDLRFLADGTACSFGDGTAQHRIWAKEPRPNAPVGISTEVLYVEDNAIHSTGGLINFIDANYAGRYVVRFNTITAAAGAPRPYAEVHGVQGGNRAVQWKELYGNVVSDTPDSQDNFFGLLFMRSGSGVVFKNRVPTSSQTMRINIQRACESVSTAGQCNGSSNWDQNTSGQAGYACRDQIGRMKDRTFWTPGSAYAQDLMPFYFWNNYKGTGTTQDAPELHSDPSCPAIANLARQNRDWYTENTSFNGTTGVGSGSFANRPDTCTTGVAYWATDQGEWNSKVSGPDGQLYKCTATNTWTLYYIPLRYPHPLQSNLPVPEAPSDLTAD